MVAYLFLTCTAETTPAAGVCALELFVGAVASLRNRCVLAGFYEDPAAWWGGWLVVTADLWGLALMYVALLVKFVAQAVITGAFVTYMTGTAILI